MATIRSSTSVICLAALLGACSSSGTTLDGWSADLRRSDFARGEVGGRDTGGAKGDTSPTMCPGATCVEEDCLDAKATQPPVFAWTAAWAQASNANFFNQVTTEARRCQWSSLSSSCTMYDCLSDDWSGAAATMTGPSAGTITVGRGTGDDLVFTPDANGVYQPRFWNAHWKEGDQITFTAQGATIPPFGLKIAFPGSVSSSNPIAQDAGVPQVDRSVPMTFTWTPTDEKVLVAFWQLPTTTSPAMDRQEVWCIFDGAAGTGTVPVNVLQRLKTNLNQGGYCIGHYKRRCYSVGGVHIQATGVNGLSWSATFK